MMELLSGECDHQTVMKNMCAECGADLEQDMSIVPSANKPNRSQISIVHSIPELKISSDVSLILMLNMGSYCIVYLLFLSKVLSQTY